MLCPNCGYRGPGKFCSKCGARLISEEQAAATVPLQNPVPANQRVNAQQAGTTVPLQNPVPAAQRPNAHQASTTVPLQNPAAANQRVNVQQGGTTVPLQNPAAAAQRVNVQQAGTTVPLQNPAPAAQRPNVQQGPMYRQDPAPSEQYPPAQQTPPAPQPEEPEKARKNAKKKAKKKKGLLIGILVAAVLLAILGVGGYFYGRWYFSPEQSIARAIKKGDLNEALRIYYRELDGEENSDIADYLSAQLETIRQSYIDGQIGYSEASEELDELRQKEYEPLNEQISAVGAEIGLLQGSRDAFASAEALFESKSYMDAYAAYGRVIEADGNYAAAREKMDSCITLYRQEILDAAEALAAESKFDQAIKKLEEGMTQLPQDAVLQEKKEEYAARGEQKTKADALSSGENFADSGDYPSAIKAINEGLKKLPDDPDLMAAFEQYREIYLAAVFSEADALMAEYKYDEAIKAVNNAYAVLPNDASLSGKISELKSKKPIPLDQGTLVNGGFPWREDDPIDPFGNDYSDSVNYACFEYSTAAWNSDPFVFYAEYRTYKKYRVLKGEIVPHEDIYETGTAEVNVYADDVLVYSSPLITRKTDLFPFSVDISDAEYVKVEVICYGKTSLISEQYDVGAVILKDFYLCP